MAQGKVDLHLLPVLLFLCYVNTPATDTSSIKPRKEYLANSSGVKGKKIHLQ